MNLRPRPDPANDLTKRTQNPSDVENKPDGGSWWDTKDELLIPHFFQHPTSPESTNRFPHGDTFNTDLRDHYEQLTKKPRKILLKITILTRTPRFPRFLKERTRRWKISQEQDDSCGMDASWMTQFIQTRQRIRRRNPRNNLHLYHRPDLDTTTRTIGRIFSNSYNQPAGLDREKQTRFRNRLRPQTPGHSHQQRWKKKKTTRVRAQNGGKPHHL